MNDPEEPTREDAMSAEYRHMLAKCRDANNGGWSVLSTGEKLAAALVLNRADWLAQMDYTIAQAINRIGPEWAALIPEVAGEIEAEAWDRAPAVGREFPL